jgi:hypothetical protein
MKAKLSMTAMPCSLVCVSKTLRMLSETLLLFTVEVRKSLTIWKWLSALVVLQSTVIASLRCPSL